MSTPPPQDAFLDLFAAEAPEPEGAGLTPWKILVVDDEPDIHSAFSLALRGLTVEGAPLALAHAESAEAARALLADQPETALVLLDVVMERMQAGLDLVRHIRTVRGDQVVQIILVTGQPGYAPQRQVVQDYAINGYCLKAELTSDRILAAVVTALRTHRLLRDLDRERERLRLATQGLKAERSLKAAIVESSDDAIIGKTLDGVVTSWNHAAERMFGYTEQEMIGQPVLTIIPPERHAEEAQVLASLRQGVSVRHYETERLCKDGSRLPISLTVSPIRDTTGRIVGGSKIARDISERHQAEAERARLLEDLQQSVSQLDAIYTQLPYLVVLFDGDGRYVRVNPAAVRTFGFDPTGAHREDVAFRLQARFPDGRAIRAGNLPSSPAVAGQMVTDVEYLITDAGGEDHILLLNALPIMVGGEVRGVLAAMIDITRQRRMEAEARILQAQFLQTQKMESLGILAGGVAHDMNNVLGAILALASAQQTFQPEGSPLRQAFETIASAANRGGRMVKSLLNFARQSPAEVLDVDLNQVLREDVTLLERTTFAHIQLKLDLEERLPHIQGDPGNLAHAIMNLCVNAVDAMASDGTLTLRTRRTAAGRVQVQVQDTGCGMSPEVLKRAMEPFYTTKEVGKGTGLGLAMVFSIMQAHQGTLDLESEPGRGTVVTLEFPASAQPAAPLPAARKGQPRDTAHLQVLLVDDDELIRSSTRILLEALGHGVTAVDSGEEALRVLAGGSRPNLVLLDMNMPGWGGAGTLPRLRALLPELPVLLTTGRADQTALDLVAANPPMACLPKPFTVEDLLLAMGSMVQGA